MSIWDNKSLLGLLIKNFQACVIIEGEYFLFKKAEKKSTCCNVPGEHRGILSVFLNKHISANVLLPYSLQKVIVQAVFNSMRQQMRLFGYGYFAMKICMHQ